MRNKRHLFFILILFLIISSVSFVCASENVTHNGNTKEIATLSFSDDSADEDVTDVHLDSVNKSSNSALGLAGDAQNTNDTGNDSCLTDKSQILRASNDGRIDEKGILTVKNAQLLGVPNNEPVLGNPIYPSGTTMKDVMRAILSAQPGDTVYLGGLTYTGSDTTQTDGQVYVKNVKIVGGTPDNPNMYAKFDVGNDWQSAMYFRGKSEKIQVVIDNKTQEKSSYFTNTGYFFDGVTFEHINCTGKFLDFSVGEWKNSAIIDCYSKYQFVCFTGSHHDNVPMSIINCNFTECHQTYKGKNGVEDGTGQLGAVFGVNMVNCKFINTSSAQHGGALCIADESEWGSSSVATTLTGCEFINVTSRWFAIYIHGDFRTSYDHITSPQIIDNCKFINCLGTGEYSGAVGISHDGLIVKNSLFENCSGGQGGAIMVGGIDGNHDGFSGRNTKGNNVEINNCTFNYNVASLNKTSSHCYPQYYENGTQKHGDEDFYPSGNAGAVYVFGNNTKIIDSTFNGNVAESGNGSAIMIKGINTTVTNSKFYNHTSDNGTVFIIGNNTKIINSIFENNTANNNGAGIYVKGNNTLVNESIFINQNATNGGAVYLNGNNATIINSTFTNNTVTNQGGAIYVNGSNTKLLKNEFYDNVAVPLTASSTDFTGLGGAFYVKGDNTYSELNYYDHNIARNGSAIYTDGKNFTIISDKFFENQAWSYLLEVTADPEVSLYNTSDVVIQVHHVGGDNILNAIHNVADYSEIFLKNVTYENSYGDNITTVNELKNPLEHPNSENLNEPYQEDSELYQNIDIVVYDKDNELIADVSDKRTDVRGIVTITIPKSDLTKVGDYKVHAEHDYDWNYLPINHDGKFRILGYVDLSVNKTSDKDEYFIGDTVTWTITVKNADNATAATYVNLTDVLPSEFTYVSCDPDGEYSSQSNNWTIGTIEPGETKTLTITTTAKADGIFDNVAQVYSYEEDWNTTNNKDNKTVKVVKLGVEKTVNNNTPYVGDTIEYTLTITNDGVNDYVRHLKVVDELPDGLIFADEGEISGADLINKTVVVGSKKATWYINNIPANSQAFIIVKVNVTDDGSLKNTVTIDGGSSDDETVTAVPSADLSITKTVSPETTHNDTMVTWTITVKNNGPSKAVNVKVNDALPKGLVSFKEIRNDGGSFVNGVWNVGDMENGVVCVLVLESRVNATNTTITNVVNVTSDTHDPHPENNSAENKTAIPPEADLSIVKTVDCETTHNDTVVTWTIVVTNNGPDDALNVTVCDAIPNGLVYISADSDYSAVFNDTHVVWKIPKVVVGTPVSLTLKTRVNATNRTITNVVNVTSDIYDPFMDNNTAENKTVIPPEADLEVNKTVSASSVHNGTVVFWTITVKNNGPDNATNVRVTDALPKGLVGFEIDTIPDGTTFENGVWSIGDMNNGSVLVLVLKSVVNATNTTIVNNVSVTNDIYDPNPDNNNGTNKTVVPPEADLSIVKTVDCETTHNDTVVTWTIVVTNNGPDDALNVTVCDAIPDGLVYISADSDYSDFNGTHVVWEIPKVVVGTPVSLTLKTRVNAANRTITNVVNVTSDIYDPFMDNNTAENKTVIPPEADLEVNKTVSASSVHNGTVVFWTITVKNNGPDNATNVRVTDALPKGLVGFEIDTIPDGTTFENGVWSIGDMNNGSVLVLVLKSVVNATNTTIVNNVSVTNDIYDPNPDNNNGTNKTVVPPEADLSIVKTVDCETTHNDTVVTWTIVVTNNGPDDALNVTVCDAIPDGLVYISADSDYSAVFNGTHVVWEIPKVVVGTPVSLTLKTRVNATNRTITNVVNVTSDIYDPFMDNNTAENKTVIPPEADLEVNKTVSASSVHNGTVVFWTITVKNNGPDNATNVRVTDALPKGLVGFEIDTIPDGTTFENGVWSIGDMNNGSVLVLVLKSVVNATNTTIVNNVSVTNDIYDPNPDNNNGTNKTVVPPEADLSIVKTVDCETTHNDTVVTWTIVVTNNGPDDALNVRVTDAIPNGLVYIPENSDSHVVFNGTHVVWEIPKVVVGTPVSLTLKTRVNAANRTITNVVNVTSDIYDPFMDNNTAENKTVIPPEADLSIVKTVDPKTTHNGTDVIWTIVVTNNGPDDALNVTVCDAIPDGLVYIPENSDSHVVFNGTHVVWEIPKVVVGTPVSLTLKTRVNATNRTITNVVNVTSDIYDPFMDNNTAENKTVIPPEADLEVNKTVSASSVHNGTVVFWTITVKNNGPDNATNVRVTDALPKGLVGFEIDTIPDGTTFENGVWSIGDMNNGSVLVLVLKSVVNATNTTIVNNVSVTNDIYDPNPDNNNGTNKTVVPPEADLSIVKTVDCEITHNDTVVTWTIVVTNNGPDDALNVRVTDAIPDGLVYISADSDYSAVFNGTHVVWEIPKVVVGTPVSLTLKTRVNATNRTITNVVNVTSDIYDPFMDNNTSENKTVIPPEVYLDVNKTVEPGRVYYGDTVVFTINVTNNGPDNATNVVVKDLVPEQFKVTGANDTNFNGTHIVIPKIVPGGHYAFTITAIAIANGTWNNTASAFCVENQTIIDDDATVIVDPFADVSVNITSDKDEYFVDDVAIWTIVVSNAANGTNATNVNLKDLFPSDYFEFVNCTDEYGNVYDLGDDWIVPFMGNGTDVTFVIYSVAVTPGVDINNTAKVNCTEDEWNYDNNNATKLVDVVVLPQPVKEVSNSTPYYHDTIEYNLTVVNDGKDNYMDNLTVVDSLPSGLHFLETVGIVGAEFVGKEMVDGQVITWTVTNISARATITVRVKVNDLGSLTNNLTIIGPRGTEATVNCTINPVALADVSVNITSDKDEYFVGDVAIWTIVVSNAANGTNATNVSLKDLFPSDYFEFVNCTDENGNVYDLGDDWVIPFVGNGTNVTFLIHSIAKVPAENITNSVNVTCNEKEWNYDNNNASKTVEIVAFHKPVKTVSNSTPYYHDVVEYTLTVMNLGDTMYMSEFDVIDSLPDGLKYLGTVNISGAFLIRETENGQVVTWVLTQIPARSNATIVIRVQVNDLGSLTNNLTVVGPHGATDMVDCTIDPIALTDVSVNITSDKDEYFVDEIAIWTVTVSNAGNGTNATNVNLKDLFPSEFEFVDCILPNGTTYNSTTGVWDIGFMGNGTDVTLVIISRAKTPADNITNSVNATCSEDEWNYINNVADKTVRIVPFPEIEKAVSNATPYNHDAVEYTLTVKNIADIKYADNLVVIDSLPAGLIFRGTVSIIGADIVENEAVDGQTITWVITNISAKSSAVITVKVFVNDTGDFTNNLTVISPNGYNDTVNCTITAVPIADLEVIKSNDFEVNVDENLYNGDKVTWTIKVINKGPDDAINTIVTDELPAGLIYDSDDYGGIYDQGIVSWNVGNLPSGESVTIHIVTLIKASNVTITNPVGVTSDTHDPDESNNHDNSSVYVEPEADLEIIKSVSDKSPQKGDMITWTIIVKNNGADTAVNAVVTDKLPSGVVYDSDNSNGAYDSITGIWNVGDLASGESASLRIYTKVVVTNKVIVNLASVTSDTYDPNEENNYCNDSTTVPPVSDLEVTAVPDVTSVTVGDEVEYTITVVNHGPDAAINTFAKIVIPDSLRFLGVKPSKGTYDPETGIWTIGDLEPGEKAVLKLDTKVVKAGSISIKVSVESDTYDANLTNNIEPVKINPKEPNHRNGTDVPHGNSSDVPSGKVYSPEKMPATGNPIVMMLLALLAMVGLTSKRKS